MYTDTVTIYRVSIPFSLICSLTTSMGTSSLWKIPAAKAASTSVFSKTSEKCSTFPAPLEAITGMVTAFFDEFGQLDVEAAIGAVRKMSYRSFSFVFLFLECCHP
jgi:hypothetical protein